MYSEEDDNNEQLIRHLDREMTDAERESFIKKLDSDAFLRSESESMECARNAILLYGIKKEVSLIHEEYRVQEAKVTPVIKMAPYSKIFRYGIAAACIALIFFAVNRYSSTRPSAEVLYAQQYIPFESSETRGAGSEMSPTEKAYRYKDFNKVISIYKAEGFTNDRQMVLTGVSYLEINKPRDAIQIFSSVLSENKKQNKTDFNDEANYFLALAYLKNKEYSRAAELMKKIHADKQNPYSSKLSAEYIRQVNKL